MTQFNFNEALTEATIELGKGNKWSVCDIDGNYEYFKTKTEAIEHTWFYDYHHRNGINPNQCLSGMYDTSYWRIELTAESIDYFSESIDYFSQSIESQK